MRDPILDQRVTFRRKSQVRQADGTLATTLATIATVWAEVKPKSGTQRSQSQQTENPADFEIKIRNSSTARTITPSDILEWRGNTMDIIFAPPASPRDAYLNIDAKAGVAV